MTLPQFVTRWKRVNLGEMEGSYDADRVHFLEQDRNGSGEFERCQERDQNRGGKKGVGLRTHSADTTLHSPHFNQLGCWVNC